MEGAPEADQLQHPEPGTSPTSAHRSMSKNASPYLQSATAGSTKGSPKGLVAAKSQHMQTIKSLGLLHDLQTYIQDVETIAVEQASEEGLRAAGGA
jgi:hypothetical protein